MYQPRRADGPAAQTTTRVETSSAGSASTPRRVERRWYQLATDRIGQVFLGLAVTGTAGALAIAGTASAAPAALPVTTPDTSAREDGLSRANDRPQIAAEDALAQQAAAQTVTDAVLQPTRTMYAKKPITVLTSPKPKAKKVASVKVAAKVTVTPTTVGKYRMVRYSGKPAWVLNASLSKSKPSPAETAKGNAPAATRKVPGGSVLGLQPSAMVVYRAVMSRWAVKTVGGWRAYSRSVHQYGLAIDFMTYNNTEQGYAVANFLVANAKELGIDNVIYRQRIWSTYRNAWRGMEDRGNPTDNHMDHVHVAMKR